MFRTKEHADKSNYLASEFVHAATALQHVVRLSIVLGCDVTFLPEDSFFMVVVVSSDGIVEVIDENDERGWNLVPADTTICRELILQAGYDEAT